ncbi:MAG: hypothetical protein M1820_006358 [Bogoriella megaspora]|nr:MAG: hypothetical protein M1820_006358 [Bogoriella megaspora]
MPRVITSKSRDQLSTNLESLMRTLKEHPLYSAATPAMRGKMNFLWDFINTSKRQLDRLDAKKLDRQDANETASYNSVIERCIFTQVLINDVLGKPATINGEDQELTIDFGSDIKAKIELLIAQSDFSGRSDSNGRAQSPYPA